MNFELLNSPDPSGTLKDVIIPLVSAAVGAVVGAAASYLPARMLAKRASDEVLKRDKAARRDQDLRAAHQVFVKLSILANSVCGYHKQVEDMIAKADRDGNSHMPIWQRLSTFAGIEREQSVEFTADELSIYIAAKRPDYVDDLLLLARRYAANLSNLSAFAKLKSDLHYETIGLGETTRAETGVSTTRMHVPREIANSIRVRSEELEMFASQMRSMLAEDNHFARDVADRFREVTEVHLGQGSVPSFTPKEDDELS